MSSETESTDTNEPKEEESSSKQSFWKQFTNKTALMQLGAGIILGFLVFNLAKIYFGVDLNPLNYLIDWLF